MVEGYLRKAKRPRRDTPPPYSDIIPVFSNVYDCIMHSSFKIKALKKTCTLGNEEICIKRFILFEGVLGVSYWYQLKKKDLIYL